LKILLIVFVIISNLIVGCLLVVSDTDGCSVYISDFMVLQSAQVVCVEEQKDHLQAAATLTCCRPSFCATRCISEMSGL